MSEYEDTLCERDFSPPEAEDDAREDQIFSEEIVDTTEDTNSFENAQAYTPTYTLYELVFDEDTNENAYEEPVKACLEEHFHAFDPYAPLLVSVWTPSCDSCVTELLSLNDVVNQEEKDFNETYGSNELQEKMNYHIKRLQEILEALEEMEM